MGSTLNEGMLIRHVDLRRVTPSLRDYPDRFAIMIEHVDGTNYMVSVADEKKTPEHMGALLVAVGRGANMMFHALDILRTVGYVDVPPIALLGRQIVFGLDRVTLELEIIEHSDGELECGISVAGMNMDNVGEVDGVLKENGINVI